MGRNGSGDEVGSVIDAPSSFKLHGSQETQTFLLKRGRYHKTWTIQGNLTIPQTWGINNSRWSGDGWMKVGDRVDFVVV